MPPPDPTTAAVRVGRVRGGRLAVEPDVVAVEEPLELRVRFAGSVRRVAVTMRTPGADADLAVGHLFTEGVLTDPGQVAGVRVRGNLARVDLAPGVVPKLGHLARRSVTSSACGVCGKASLAAVRVVARHTPPAGRPVVPAAVVCQLPATLRLSQPAFDRTGGLHAAALFDAAGDLHLVREDVGRHNALDKLLGHEFRAGRTPLFDAVVLVSGRLSFELVQKAAVAGVPVLAAVGAPSSLAVDLARAAGITLIGFVRPGGFNVYCGTDRVADSLRESAVTRGASDPPEWPAGRPAG